MTLQQRDAMGRYLPGHSGNSSGRPPLGHSLAEIIRLEFGKEMEIWVGEKATKLERRQIMADALAQLISTGEVVLPDRMVDGKLIPGKHFKYPAGEWLKHLIRVLRYVEPPITEVAVSGGVEGIVFDKEIEADEQ